MRRVLPAVIGLAVSMVSVSAGSQTLLQPTPVPVVTAENEPWFVSRVPLAVGGVLYFPAGPQVHFNRDEMVASGFYGRVPLYVQTTLEPRSVIFVPLSGGLMQPYERRRAGELAGTEGSRPPSFPVENAAESFGREPRTLQAPRPPISGVAVTIGTPAPTYATAPPPMPAPVVGTTGRVDAVRRQPLASASRPQGLNGIFINYSDRRWFNSSEAVPFDATFKRIGTYGTLPVYSRPESPDTIFVPVSEGASALVVPYSSARVR
jgi:hypothetical protein